MIESNIFYIQDPPPPLHQIKSKKWDIRKKREKRTIGNDLIKNNTGQETCEFKLLYMF